MNRPDGDPTVVQQRTSHPYDTFFTRRVSIVITRALAPTRISANHVSAGNIAVGLAACALLAFGNWWQQVLGAALVHAYAVLDSVDGELARLRQDFTIRGLFLEDLSAYYVIVGFPMAVGIAVWQAGLSPLPLILSCGYAAFGRNGVAVARRAVLKSIQTRRPTRPMEAGGFQGGSRLRHLIDGHLLNHTNIRAAISTVVIVEVAAGRSPVLAWWLLTIVVVGLLAREALTVFYFLRASTLDAMLWEVYRDARAPVAQQITKADALRLAKY